METYVFDEEDIDLLLNSPSSSTMNGLEISPLMLTPPPSQLPVAQSSDSETEAIETETSETDVSETESEYEPLSYVVREIKGMREVRGQLQLLVQYAPSYEPFDIIAEDVPEMVRDFLDDMVETRNNKKARAMAVEYFLNH